MEEKSCNNLDNNKLLAQSFFFFFFILLLECLRRIIIDLKWERGYWKGRYTCAKEREALLKQEQEKLKARIKYLEKQIYSKKTELLKNKSGQVVLLTDTPKEKRKRGHQAGSPGHPRRDYSHLPVVTTEIDIEASKRCCPQCHLPFQLFPTTEDSEVIEIEVKAYRRRYKRKKYTPTCHCGAVPGIITAPAPEKLLAKNLFGISIWVHILLEKYLYQRPINRLLESLKDMNAGLSPGTIGDGLKKLVRFFEPIYQAIIEKGQTENHWHADETRWFVFEMPEGKHSHRWYLWVFVSATTVVYILDPTRSTAVITGHLGEVDEGILSVDRYAAYKSFSKSKPTIILAYCWTHVRRDFLDLATSWPDHEPWALKWVKKIGEIFHLNKIRLSFIDAPSEFEKTDQKLRAALSSMVESYKTELPRYDPNDVRSKVLTSLKNHWDGLLVFVDHPHIPMDNSEAERRMRTPGLGRKNYYGSVTIWSGNFTACMFTVFQTMKKWGVNSRDWLTDYLESCAKNKGSPPKDLSAFLPWQMSKERLEKLSYPDKRNRSD